MTEKEWLRERHAIELWKARIAQNPRRRRLTACACARRVLPLLDEDPAAIALVEAAEQYADGPDRDGPKNWKALVTARVGVQRLYAALENVKVSTTRRRYALNAVWAVSVAEARNVAEVFQWAHMARRGRPLKRGVTEPAAQHAIVRDIFGNPFRLVTFSPEWRTDTAVSLARTMYESREFGAMPILADALQDADCDNDDILNHCRDATQVHVRGCWVTDLVLGKE